MPNPPAVKAADARRLVAAVADIADATTEPADRRQRLLETLGELIGADAGHWSWGRGHPRTEGVVLPVAVLFFGYTADHLPVLHEMAQDDTFGRVIRPRVVARFDAESQACVTCRDVFTPDEWAASRMRTYVTRLGMDSWAMAVRYTARDTWSNYYFLRRRGRAEFGPREVGLINLALAAVGWLHPGAAEVAPPGAFAGLTPRQRVVASLLLDGLSRKQIAGRLRVGENTVGDHVKTIYQHFGVHSSAELAALFLKGR